MRTKLIIFGITGDLSTRKLLPSIAAIQKSAQHSDMEIIGVSRRQVEVDELLKSSLGDTSLGADVSIYTMNLAQAADYEGLKKRIALRADEQALIYLSVPPASATQIVDFLGEAGLNTPNVKLLFEKPFGMDVSTANDMIGRTGRYFDEAQIYRIDHYLAKEMAQNLVTFRTSNALFRVVWDKTSIEKIEVVALETIGIEGRTQFYEQTGALRDVVQGHLMQLLALTIMDLPDDPDWPSLPALRLAALEGLKPADPLKARRAQYQGYQAEVKNAGSITETFVSLTLESESEKWQGVPFVLTSGKAMHAKTTEVRVYFKRTHQAQSNRLVFRIQPDEGIEIDLVTKKPGYERDLEPQKLAFNYPHDSFLPEAYEQVLVDAIRSQKSLFTSAAEVLRSWQIVQPLLDNWSMANDSLPAYTPGSFPNHIAG